jgi:predicted ATPase/transcriptional regulator with GAF, ATPase, and Fis domain
MLPGYEAGQELLRGGRHVLLRGRRLADGSAVLIKACRGDPPAPADAAALRHEHEILRDLPVPGVVRPRELARHGGSWFLILEDPGVVPLPAPAGGAGRDLASFFERALRLAEILEEVHRRRIVHRNIHPGAVLVAPAAGDVLLADFTLASRLSSESQHPVPPTQLLGALPYMSPEQTGRMNRTTDYRTDFYSLGAVFYEMLAGGRPFLSEDPLELIHAHIARTPRPPSEVDPEVPEALSRIVMKLLSKTAEDRYQSAAGLREDLEHCASLWSSGGGLAPFPLGQRDVSDRFVVPQRLYGREREVAALLDAFEGVCRGPAALMLVAGYSGIGKTSLIQELYKPIVRQRGYFISGKFDLLARNVPFGALINAFQALVRQLLTEGEEALAGWRDRIAGALGPNGGVLTEVIPEMELILGRQPEPPPLGPAEAQNRFQLVFQNFLSVLARKEHPLVIFLDDLQWADAATLGILRPLLTSPDVRHLILIGAYRDNEVGPSHPVSRTVEALVAAGVEPLRIALGPLGPPDVLQLVRDCLHADHEEARPLAELVQRKTDGNPFFVIQFLKTVQKDGLITFDHAGRRWAYDLPAVAAAPMTDNVIDLMTRKIQQLPERAQRALTLAACAGNRFDLRTLATVSEQTPRAARTDLEEPIGEGLVLPLPEGAGRAGEDGEEGAAAFAFLHDRVQQAAYALIPEDRRQHVHLGAGRLLRDRWDRASEEERIFEIVNHLNLGSALMTDEAERISLAELNLAAGRKAKLSTAYEAAFEYLGAGIGLLGEAGWTSRYPLAYALHIEAAETAYLSGRFEESERLFALILDRAREDLEKAEVHVLRVLQYENMARYTDAVKAGLDGLALLDASHPVEDAAKAAALDAELAGIETLLGGRPIGLLEDLPILKDPRIKMVMRLLTSIWAPAYIAADAPMTSLISARMVRLSLVHGNTEESAYGYVTHAITVGSRLGDHRTGHDFGRLALAVNEKLRDPKHRAKVHHMFSCFVNLWRMPLGSCFPHSREAYRAGLETGDFAYATYGVFHESWYGLLAGDDLRRFQKDYAPNVALLRKIRTLSFADAQQIILSWGLALEGLTEPPGSLSGGGFDEAAYAAKYAGDPFFQTFLHVVRLHLLHTFERHDEAAEAARAARSVVHSLGGTIWTALLDAYEGLNLAALHPGPEPPAAAVLERLARLRDALAARAEDCPETFRTWHLLLAAEVERAEGRPSAAMDLFERALAHAGGGASLFEQALAAETYGKFLKVRRSAAAARALLGEAHRRYARWGAAGKARLLEERHGPFEQDDAAGAAAAGAGPPAGLAASGGPGDALLDIATVAKASSALASELVLADFLRTLVRIAVENAGAERGWFLHEQDGRLVVEGEGPADGAAGPSRAVVNYVRATRQVVVLSDAASDERFAGDPQIAAARPRSVLCVPLVHQGALGGILYLVNDQVCGAFTGERVRVMTILSSQAAVCLENARLYEGMRQEVDRRRKAEEDLRAALGELQALKNRLQAENLYLQEEIRKEHNFDEMVGSHPALLAMLRTVERVAPTDSTVLIHGETGTGKELVARALHSLGARKDRPLVKVNCGAIPAGLVESELFGHVKGAFTGALERRIGRFELASGGTIFLDEVGELPPDVQVKLLRVLQEREMEPVGSSRPVKVDVRVIAATNRDLEEQVRAGRFRSDLYFRLNVFPIQVPPLRDRRSDIPQLVAFFLSRLAKKLNKTIEGVTRETMDRLMSYAWPGNVRELQNIIERAAVLSQGPVLSLAEDLLPAPASAPPAGPAPPGRAEAPGPPAAPAGSAALEAVERGHILAVLEETRWVIEGKRGAAKLLALHPNTLRSRMKKLGIRRPATK